MKPIHPPFYTEQEKDIFINYFIKKGNSCKTDFVAYFENYLNTYGKPIDGLFETCPANKIYLLKDNWTYNTHHVLWNNEKKDNLITFVLSHPEFQSSNTRLKNIDKMHPNWHHVNNDGNGALHLLAIKKEIGVIKELIQQDDYKLDPNILNHNRDYFTFLLLDENLQFPGDDEQQLTRKMTYLNNILPIYQQYSHHFENTSLNKIREIEKLFTMHVKHTYNLYEKRKLNSTTLNIEYAEDYFKQIDTIQKNFFGYHLLQKTMPESAQKKTIKNKI